MNFDPSFLRAALSGYESQLMRIEKAMAELRRKLKIKSPAGAGPARRRKRMSAAARRRIAAAQKKRWAAYRKSKGSK